jgi:allantoin racemase
MEKDLRILWINPVGSGADDARVESVLDNVRRPDVRVHVEHLAKGPDNLEYHYYEHLVMDDVLGLIRRAERDGYHAAVIACFYDPGLREARELVRIPVTAPAEASMHVAATLGHKFSIIVGRRKWVPKMEDNVITYGLEKKLASFRILSFTVNRMRRERKELEKAITREAKLAIVEDGAEVIILGCTVEAGFSRRLMQRLKVPVIDPVIISFKYAELLADLYCKLGLAHSKIYGYESPPKEDGWLKQIETE